MVVKAYLEILQKRWRLVLAGFAFIFLITLVFTLRQPKIYAITTTFVMRPRAEFNGEDDFVRALEIASRRVEINTTFAEIVGSKLIESQATAFLDLAPDQAANLAADARVIGGTNILEVTVTGQDPVILRDFSDAIGIVTLEYVANLYEVFELEPLDAATVPSAPESPIVGTNLALGALFGLVLGLGMAILAEYLEGTTTDSAIFNIIERESGAYSKPYLVHRLSQEMSRSKRHKYPLALGVIKVDVNDVDDGDQMQINEVIRLVRLLAEKLLRPEDIIARFDECSLAILLPDRSERQANTFMAELNSEIEMAPWDTNNGVDNLTFKTQVNSLFYGNYRVKQAAFMEQASTMINGSHGKKTNGSNGKKPVSINNSQLHSDN